MKRVILGIFYAILFLTVGIIICLSVSKPQNNLIPWQMAVGTVVFTAFFACVAYYWKCKNFTCNRWVKIIILIGVGALLYIVGATRGLLFGGFGDYPAVYRSAQEMATVGELSYPRYFLTYGNNVRPMLFLSVLFKISHGIGLNEYYFTLCLSVLTAVAAMWAIGKLVGDNSIYQIPSMLFVAICLPIFVFTPSFYTDTMSFGVGVTALALIKIALNKNKRWYIYITLASFLTIYGVMWKITSIIPLFATAITVLIMRIRIERKKVAFGIFSVAIFVVLINVWSSSYSIYNESKKSANPLISWIAIGMVGDGSWLSNREFANTLNSIDSKALKEEFAKEYIKNNISEGLSATHISAKIRNNFAGGTFSSKDYLSETSDGTFLWELMAPWGKYYWRTSQYCFIYVFLIYTFMFIGSIVAVVDLARGYDIPFVKVITDISFFGIVLFLMIWESNNRQMYNQLPVLVVNLFANTEYLLGKVHKRRV
ncbi:hypothetical protein SAMN02910339_00750 [Lachnospiraceae bacterium YSD2013]|nr:hypothetical protein SAMN02910339_00750 [Lachnospiraceae bacterium YSD2013]